MLFTYNLIATIAFSIFLNIESLKGGTKMHPLDISGAIPIYRVYRLYSFIKINERKVKEEEERKETEERERRKILEIIWGGEEEKEEIKWH